MDPRAIRIEALDYNLPDDKIARYPLAERDASKLLVYNNGNITEDVYRNISTHISANSLLVFNQTRVVHARLLFKKPTGGTIEIFCLEPHQQYADIQTAMLQKGQVWWNCLVGGAGKWKHGTQLSIDIEEPAFTLTAGIAAQEAGSFTIELAWDNDMSFAEVLHYAGKVPLPPYLDREVEPGDEERYQTIYAKDKGSVAAPTAGLHFTENVMKDLKNKGIDTSFITLHVGAGTFKPVKSATMEGHDMHAEWIDVDVEIIQKLVAQLETGNKIVAVGTTSMRTLESLYWIGAQLMGHTVPDFSGIAVGQWQPYEMKTDVPAAHALQAIVDHMLQNHDARLVTRTQIMIAPGYKPKIIDGLITNFHQPRSTLLLLIAAVIGDSWRRMYDHALAHDFRFLSYGDGCLLWKQD